MVSGSSPQSEDVDISSSLQEARNGSAHHQVRRRRVLGEGPTEMPVGKAADCLAFQEFAPLFRVYCRSVSQHSSLPIFKGEKGTPA